VQVGGIVEDVSVRDGDRCASLTVDLEAGETRLQTWLYPLDGSAATGAYYVYVERLVQA
jgi:hypothetical protein